MFPQSLSDRLIAIGVATMMHVALGCALFLAARVGVTTPAANSSTGKMIVLHLVPRTRHDGARTIASASGQVRAGTTLPFAVEPRVHNTDIGTPALRKTDPHPTDDRPADPGATQTAMVESPTMPALPSAEVIAFRARLEAHLAQYRLYPADARNAGSQGIVILHFAMDHQGRVGRAWIETSSGVPAIDREALEAVQRAVPLPVPPSDFPDTLDIRVPVSFKLS